MPRYEYKVIPTPRKGEKAKGVKGSDGRIAQALQTTLNDMAASGWDYLRADTVPCDERTGLTGRTTTFQTVLVFRREVAGDAAFGKIIETLAHRDDAPAESPPPQTIER